MKEQTLGKRIDELFKLRAAAAKVAVKLEAAKAAARIIEDELLREFGESDLDGAKGVRATATVSSHTVASIEDYEAFTAYVEKTKAFDLFQRRVHVGALKDRLEAKQTVPGVTTAVIKSVRLTARK